MTAMPRVQRVLMLALVLLLAAIGVVLLTATRQTQSPHAADSSSPFDGPVFASGLHAANFSLVDQNGHRVTLSQYRGKVVILTFIHSLCHDTCPFMVEQIKGALNDLPGSGRGIPTIAITAAPAEDTVANRKKFLARHQMARRVAFLNGNLTELKRVWHAYAIEPVTPKIDHSTFVLLIDKRGLERVGYPADQLTPEDLAHDVGVLERAPA